MATNANQPNRQPESLRDQVRSAVLWRSGAQIVGQIITWSSTFLVIRVLDPQDYGLFAMTQVVLTLLDMLNGYGLSSALIQQKNASRRQFRQLFGMLLLLNGGIALFQFLMAPLAASYFQQPVVADLLRVQALIFLTTPFIALAYTELARRMDFRRQAQVNLVSSLAGALTALAGAYAGLGVWTLVFAPMVLFGGRAIGMTLMARTLMWPSFDFRGAGAIAKFGGLMAAGQIFWFLQSQADVLIAGRSLDPHWLGIYTTSLFLTQIFVAKFVPPLNDVAFSAYSRIQADKGAVANAFAKSARIILLAAMPFYCGLAATAEPVVGVVLGEKWLEAVPFVRLLALAMPFMTLQILFAPAANARGHPGVSLRTNAIGAAILPVAFLVGIQWGITGLALAWVGAYPLYCAITAQRTLPLIGLRARDLLRAIAPPILAALAMALVVTLIDRALPAMGDFERLLILVPSGGAIYLAWLTLFARDLLAECIGLVRRRPAG